MCRRLIIEWPLPQISAKDILTLLEDNDPCSRLLLERANTPDQVLEGTDIVNLADPGIEKLRVIQRISIIINGRAKEIFASSISFDEVVKLAFETPPSGTNIMFTVSFYNGPQTNPEGSMASGAIVKIQTGMVFNVTATDKS